MRDRVYLSDGDKIVFKDFIETIFGWGEHSCPALLYKGVYIFDDSSENVNKLSRDFVDNMTPLYKKIHGFGNGNT